MTTPIVVQIVVDKPLPQGFDYLWDEAKLGCLPQIGHIVEIPFGRGKEVGPSKIGSTPWGDVEGDDQHLCAGLLPRQGLG